MLKKYLFLSIISLFIFSTICNADDSHLRIPISARTYERAGAAIRLKGGGISAAEKKEHDKLTRSIKRFIESENAWSLFADREPRVTGEKRITKYTSDSNAVNQFLDALGREKGALPEGFDVVILGNKRLLIGLDVIFHPGHTRNQSYMTVGLLEELSAIYGELEDKNKSAFIKVILDGFKHEAKHILQGLPDESETPMDIEKRVDEEASSYRAREFFRLVYLKNKIKDKNLQPDINDFFEALRKMENKASHLFAYTKLTPEQHLKIASKLAPPIKNGIAKPKRHRIDIMLAQHHIGHVLNMALKNPEDAGSEIVQSATKLLKERYLIDRGPETEKPYPVWKFIRELIIQDKLAFMPDVQRSNILLSDLANQLEPWQRGTVNRIGDSIRYPMFDETMPLPITSTSAINLINAIPEEKLEQQVKDKIIRSLKANDDGYVLISRGDMDAIGNALRYRAASSISAAGAGTRFAVVLRFKPDGTPVFNILAKGALELEVDGGRTFIEMFLAQAAFINKESGFTNDEKEPCIIYTSHITDNDIKEELERLGYAPKGSDSSSRYLARYAHTSNDYYSDIVVVRLKKTNILDMNNGDFLVNIDTDSDWQELHWPHAHDSSTVDLITTGLAYELYLKGKIYVDISNIDQRAGGTDPVVLAIIYLTGAPLVNEITLKPKGERGGGAPVHFKKPLFKGHTIGNLEKPNMGQALQNSLTPEQTVQYLPYKNTANYCINIIEYARQAFLGSSASDDDVIGLLKAFYDVRQDEEKIAELKFKLLEMQYRVKNEAMFIEQVKRNGKPFPAVQIGTLLGFHTWLVNTLFLEIHQGPEAGVSTRFEEQKENVTNLRNIKEHIEGIIFDIIRDKGLETDELLNNNTIIKLLLKYSQAGALVASDFPPSLAAAKIPNLTAAIEQVARMPLQDAKDIIIEKGNVTQQSGWMEYAVSSLKPKKGIRLVDFYKMASEAYDIQLQSLKRIEAKANRLYVDPLQQPVLVENQASTSL